MNKPTNQEQSEPEIVCMTNSIKIFRFYGIFPPRGKLVNPGKTFYVKFALIAAAASPILIGSALHLIKNINDHSFNRTELDITYIVSMSAGYGLICSYFTKVSTAVRLYAGLSNFQRFEKPIDFDETNGKYNKYAVLHYCYLQCIVACILIGSNVFKAGACREENETKGLSEVCGLFAYTWLPFDVDFFPAKQLYVFSQLFGADYVYMISGLAAWTVMESVEHLAVRIRHVSRLFDGALKEPDPCIRRNMFRKAVEYHKFVLSLESQLNETFNVFMFTHMVMTAPIIGYGFYAYIKSGTLASLLLAIGWLNGLFMDCRSGQRLQDESDLLAMGLYRANWLDCEIDLKRDIVFVLMRCKRRMVLRAASFGIMNHPMFLAVLKAAYSYVALMKQKENRNTSV
ncbi:unnamed protein product [Phyllotreta striolata]|uniref:Odorant receptor n=1 Tax=Phyllotreta striolata TaxID=444603 RepID=A0A9N9XLM8_PHYSR|nr:unnamed protein product [Phyllotreta striolata]